MGNTSMHLDELHLAGLADTNKRIASKIAVSLCDLANGFMARSVAVYGPRGTGKTMLLSILENHAESLGMLHCRFSGSRASTFAKNYYGASLLGNNLHDIVLRLGKTASVCRIPFCLFVDDAQHLSPDKAADLLAGIHRSYQLRLPVMAIITGTPDILIEFSSVYPDAELLFAYEQINLP